MLPTTRTNIQCHNDNIDINTRNGAGMSINMRADTNTTMNNISSIMSTSCSDYAWEQRGQGELEDRSPLKRTKELSLKLTSPDEHDIENEPMRTMQRGKSHNFSIDFDDFDIDIECQSETRQEKFECLRQLDNYYDSRHRNLIQSEMKNVLREQASPPSSPSPSPSLSSSPVKLLQISNSAKNELKPIRRRSSEIRRALFAGNRESSSTMLF